MKNPVRILIALAIAASAALVAQAQTAQKIVVVDVAKLYDGHHKTEDQNAKLRADEKAALEQLDVMNKEGNALVEQLKELDEQTKNPVTTAEAKQKAQTAAQAKIQEIQKKQQEVAAFRENTTRSLQQRVNTFKTILLEELQKLITDVAKRKNANLVFDKSGPSLIGVPVIIYSDPSMDITDEVMVEINKTRPAPVAAPAVAPASAPVAVPVAAPAAPAQEPKITVPGTKK